ncbi:MAG: SpoIVB peptidase S55 domain-containing protein [Acidobacteriota bacterium]|nr:SpoIVB peptidase S55 domain-containing protein [Acidobacteriota bacterium]
MFSSNQMRKGKYPVSFLFIFTILLSFWLSGPAQAGPVIMPLSQVKPGMKGIGKSVFAGHKIQEFNVEILGILENVQPKQNWILARLSGQNLENTGVIAGMSGSPVYIDGKIIGSVSFSYSFSREPIAGITPIEDMLAIPGKYVLARSGKNPDFSWLKIFPTMQELGKNYLEWSQNQPSSISPDQALIPIKIPVVFSGFSARSFNDYKSVFSRDNFQPVLGARMASTQTLNLNVPSSASLAEGEAVGIQLMGGDLDLTAVGTVTYVDGEKIVAFGHPFYNLGKVDYGLTRAEILTIVPSLQSSFKLAATGELIGRFSQDRTNGVLGEIGKFPRYVPVNVEIQDNLASKKQFKIKVVNDPILTPALLNVGLATIINAEERSYGNLSLDFEATIVLDRGQIVHLEDLFSGNADNPATSLSAIVAAVSYLLNNNEFQPVKISQIDLKIRAVEELRQASLEKVLLDKYTAQPGEVITARIYFRTFKNETKTEEVEFVAPPLPAGSELELVVGDAAYMQQLEKNLYRIQDFRPRSFDQLLRILSNLRKNNRIYFKLLVSGLGIFLKGEEWPDLPPGYKAMLTSPRAATANLTEISRSTLSEYQLPVPYVFKGAISIPIKIKK